MACIQYPRKERGGVNPGSWEKPTIYREPPKEIMTRKKERIEEGDVTYNIRNNPSRYNDAISNWQKGKNMMVAVDYQNRTTQLTTMDFGSASNPYKVNQSFRPPAFRQMDTQPLSRQQRPYTAAQTNIGSDMSRDDTRDNRMDRSEVSFSTGVTPLYHESNTTLSQNIGTYADNHERTDMIHDEYIVQQLLSQLKGFDSVELQKLFSYEHTPHGIVLTPLSYQALSALLGPISVESQRHIDEQSYLQDEVVQYGVGANKQGQLQYDGNHMNDEHSYLQENLQIGIGANTKGTLQRHEHHISDEEAYIQDQILIGMGANRSGLQTIDGQRNLQEERYYIQKQVIALLGVNKKGIEHIEEQRHVSDEDAYIQQLQQIGQGVNSRGVDNIQGQRHVSDEDAFIQQLQQIGQGVNVRGVGNIQGQRHVSDEDAFIQQLQQIGQGVNVRGVDNIQGQRHVSDEDAFIQQLQQIGQGVNIKGVDNIQGQRHVSDEDAFIQQLQQIGQGVNIKGVENIQGQRHVSDEDAFIQQLQQIGQGVNVRGVENIQGQRHVSDEDAFIQQLQQIGQGVNVRGVENIQGQRHVSDEDAFIQQLQQIGQGVNIKGMEQIDGQRLVTDEQMYLKHQLQIALEASKNGLSYGTTTMSDEQYYVKELVQIAQGTNQIGQGVTVVEPQSTSSFVQEQLVYGQGVNQKGIEQGTEYHLTDVQKYLLSLLQVGVGVNPVGRKDYDSQRTIEDKHYIQEKQYVGQGTNKKSFKKDERTEYQEKMKDILLKNMTSTVAIVIQKSGSTDEYQINGNIKDKIDIVVHSAKGTPLIFHTEHGEPIRLKDYTWKFVKSATGADKFVIQVPHDELELERKSELYTVSSNPSQSISLQVNDDVDLRREVRHMSAVTNLVAHGDLQRVDESIISNRVEKKTNYTDMMIQTVQPTRDRIDTQPESIRSHESSKKKNITNMMLQQSQGRFD